VTRRSGRALALAAAVALVAAGGARAEDADAGRRAFQKCYACHSVDPAERGLPGPNLAGIVGRPAATQTDFEFSDAMLDAAKKRKLVWTETALDRFLADPQAVVPGNAMNFFGLRDPAERAAVIGYLARSRR
jgi:cytochrome c